MVQSSGVRSVGATEDGRDPRTERGYALDRSSGVPLWQQLHDDLIERIEDHQFDRGFPGEHALADMYDVSRQTVRAALRPLRESGLLSAGRGLAPQVSRPIEQPLGTLYSLFASVEAAGMSQRSTVLALDVRTNPAAAARLALPAEDPLVYLERIRYADDTPLAIDRTWLPASLARPLLQADFSHTALYQEMDVRCGIKPGGGEEGIDAVNLGPGPAQQLRVPPGSAAFSVTRLGCAQGRPVEWRHTLIRADRFRVIAQFSPRAGYRLQVSTPELTAPHPDASDPQKDLP